CAASELKCACEAPRPDRVRGRRIRPKELSPKYRVRSFAQKKRFRMTASQKGGNPRSRLPIAALRPRIVVEEPCTRQFYSTHRRGPSTRACALAQDDILKLARHSGVSCKI